MVTDSTAHLAPDVVADRGVRVVPLQVIVDGRPFDDGVPSDRTAGEPSGDGASRGPVDGTAAGRVAAGQIADALRRHVPVSTSRPSPRAFLDVYESAAACGAESVVSVHLSASLSGTADAARLAARDAPVPVHVVDSRSLGMGLGYAVLAAAAAADRGLTADEVAAAASDRAGRSSAYFYVDTLDYLRRGGRVGAASAMVGSALAIKPLLYLRDGWIEPLEKVRTASRAQARLVELAVDRAVSGHDLADVAPGRAHGGNGRVDVAVHHLDNAVRAQDLAGRLADRLPSLGELVVSEVGAVIGAHVGPGLLAVVISPR